MWLLQIERFRKTNINVEIRSATTYVRKRCPLSPKGLSAIKQAVSKRVVSGVIEMKHMYLLHVYEYDFL